MPDPHYMPFFTSRGPDFVKGVAEGNRSFDAIITAEAARHSAVVVNIYHASATIWGNPKNIAPDGLHLTSSGQTAVATVFYQIMHRHHAL